jgi:hypothetical protein
MNMKAKPYSNRRVIVVGVLLATGFALLSLFFLFLQASEHHDRLAGRIIDVRSDAITIQDGRGYVTELVIAPDLDIRGVKDGELPQIGQHVMVRGDFEPDGTFDVDGMRIIEGPPKR